jgi:hypothetical protein
MMTWMLTRLTPSGPWTLFQVGEYSRTARTFPTLREAARWLAEHGEDGGQ